MYDTGSDNKLMIINMIMFSLITIYIIIASISIVVIIILVQQGLIVVNLATKQTWYSMTLGLTLVPLSLPLPLDA